MRRRAYLVLALAAVLALPAMGGCGEPGRTGVASGAGNTVYSSGFSSRFPLPGIFPVR